MAKHRATRARETSHPEQTGPGTSAAGAQKRRGKRRRKSLGREVRELWDTLVLAFVLVTLMKTFIVDLYKIPTGSMEPTLRPGDRILVLRYVYGLRVPFTTKRFFRWNDPDVGDIIVFNYPEEPKRDFIKRCVALPDDTIEILNGRLVRNNEVLKEDPFPHNFYYNRGPYGREGERLKVPPMRYYALGDNSASSKDSRYWGFLDDKYLLGKAVLIYWPLNRIRILK